MQALKKDIWLILLLLALSVPLFFLNVHNSHSAGGDDYALYIKEAKNIAEGKPYYLSDNVFNKHNVHYSPPQYPPGYPLLLAPVVKMCGIDILPLCYFNTVVAAMLLLCFFYFFRRYMGVIPATCMALMIVYGSVMMGLKQTIVADTTCLLFVMLYMVVRAAEKQNSIRMTLLVLFATMAILCRTQAVLLLLAEVIYLFYDTIRHRKTATTRSILTSPGMVAIAGSNALLFILNKTIFYTPNSTSVFYAAIFRDALQKGALTVVRDNVNFFLEAIKSFFHYDTDNSIRTAIVTIMESAGLVLCITGLLISIAKKIRFTDVFFVLMCLLMLFYPIHDARYFLPAIALVYLYSYTALRTVLPTITTIRPLYVGVAFAGIYLFAGLKYLRSTTEPPVNYVPAQNDHNAFAYLRQNVKDDELIICARPRLVSLYTDRKCIIHAWQLPMAENKRIFDSMNAKYLLIAYDIVEDYYQQYLNEYDHPVDSTEIAPGYRLYKIR
ncbi:hypothetical protein GCM10023093_12720 [Nemorincola caseinilytica]|uniref:Glycosyltransferase RgtA/B/C/D-like domain-containing protein n=1 Tax=Nemorincola caseinilytica TaxID=2054315 RepID=A0ABP8N9P5_9BACT